MFFYLRDDAPSATLNRNQALFTAQGIWAECQYFGWSNYAERLGVTIMYGPQAYNESIEKGLPHYPLGMINFTQAELTRNIKPLQEGTTPTVSSALVAR